jgi:hypothetical protein
MARSRPPCGPSGCGRRIHRAPVLPRPQAPRASGCVIRLLPPPPQAPGRKGADKGGDKGDGEAQVEEHKFDAFNGVLEGGMLANMGDYDEDDKEADKVWASIDDYMDERRRVGGTALAGALVLLGGRRSCNGRRRVAARCWLLPLRACDGRTRAQAAAPERGAPLQQLRRLAGCRPAVRSHSAQALQRAAGACTCTAGCTGPASRLHRKRPTR